MMQRLLVRQVRSAQRERLTAPRTRQIAPSLHTASRRLMDLLVAEGIGTLVVGTNPLWKQEARLGRRGNHQHVVSVPLRASSRCAPTRLSWWPSRSVSARSAPPARPASSTPAPSPSLMPSGTTRPFAAARGCSGAVSGGEGPAAACRGAWRVPDPAQSTPRRLWHGESGCGSSPPTAPCTNQARGVMVIVLRYCSLLSCTLRSAAVREESLAVLVA